MLKAPHSTLLCDIANHATATPDKIALVEGDNRITYAQLVSRIEACALFMQSLGLQVGDRVLLSAQKEKEFIYVYFAAHLLGVVNVVVDSAAPRERLDYIVNIVKPAVCFGEIGVVAGCRIIPFAEIPLDDCCETHLKSPRLQGSDVADVMFTTGTTGAPKGAQGCLPFS